MLTFYDRRGAAIAYVADDGEHIYLFSGRAVAYIYRDLVYSYRGKALGWLVDGWLRESVAWRSSSLRSREEDR